MAMLRPVRMFLKWSGIVLAALLGVAVALFAVAWLVNLRDEPLTPEAQALLRPPADPFRDDDNVYLGMAGLDAPPGESAVRVGRARVERFNTRLAAVLRDPSRENLESLQLADPDRLQFMGAFDFRRPPDSYWDDVPPHRANIEELLGENLELYQRYLALQRMHGYFETARPSYLASVYYAPGDLRTLFLAQAVLRLRSVDRHLQQAALADLGSDLRLWRTVLEGSGSLISKMIAIACLHQDEQVLADLIADPQAPVPLDDPDADALVPLFPLDTWDISRSYPLEFRVQASFVQQAHDLDGSGTATPDVQQGPLRRWLGRAGAHLEGHFFKVQATLNLLASEVARLTRAAAPIGPRTAALGRPTPPHITLDAVYNTVGRLLVFASASDYAAYPARAWDGAAFQRLLRLAYEIRRHRVAPGEIPTFMQRHPEWSTHPATGQPFVWEERTTTIRVQTSGSLPAGRVFRVHVWRAPSRAAPLRLAPAGAPR